MFPHRGRTVRVLTSLALSATLTGAGMLAVAGAAQAAPASGSLRLIARDDMHRHVTVGLGSAGRGGRYAVSALRGARVRDDHAVLGPVQPGHDVAAWLPRVDARDQRVLTTFRLARHSGLGSGEYFEVGLRRVGPTTSYIAKVRMLPGQGVLVSISRVQDGQETELGSQRLVLPASSMNKWLEVQADAVGSYPVQLGMRVWPVGHTKPAKDQVTVSDDSADRLSGAGSVSFVSYLSRSATAASTVYFRRVRVWKDTRRTLDGKGPHKHKPTPTPTPTPTPPTPTPTPPVLTGGSAANAGSAPLGQTSYPIPSGAIFVSPDGNDSGPGTLQAPLRTLAHAISVAPSGGTIVMRAGVYNESVTDNSKPLTVQNYPGETVWLDGSTSVTGWTQQGSTWVHTGWTAQFNSVPSYTGTVSSAPGWSFINSAHPMAANPDQMWIDGTPLTQVGSASDVGPGDFYADYADDELVIGSDPTSHDVRASNLGVALTTYATGFTFRGIGVRRYATAVDQFGALRLDGPQDMAQNVISTENATTGIMFGAVDPTADHVTVSDNGMLGLTGTYVDGIVVNGLLAQNNNTEGFSQSPVSGGMKIARTRGVTVRNSEFLDNAGPGAWFDESVYNSTIVGNVMSGNAGHGMSYEISSTALIADNVVQNNGGDGLKINDSDHVSIWNNTLTNNGRDIEVVEDTRRGANLSDPGHNPHVSQPDPTEPWTITNDSVMNNVFTPASGSYQLYVRDYSGQYSAADIDLQVAGNQFMRGTSQPMIVWGNASGNPTTFTSAAGFMSATGEGPNNVDITSSQTVLGNAGGVALPADVAAAVGQPTGTAQLGAF